MFLPCTLERAKALSSLLQQASSSAAWPRRPAPPRRSGDWGQRGSNGAGERCFVPGLTRIPKIESWERRGGVGEACAWSYHHFRPITSNVEEDNKEESAA